MSNTLTGTDKSVILLMTIGEDRAAEVFKHLSDREVQTLSAANTGIVTALIGEPRTIGATLRTKL